MAQISSNLLLVAFFLYLLATIFFAVSLTGKKFKNRAGQEKNGAGLLGFVTAFVALLFALAYFITRWIAAGHAPVSNLFEYTTFFGIMMSLAFVIIYPMYKANVLGFITMPVVMLIIAYASMFPQEITPLIPALQSIWLKVHVITTAFGQGILAIGFAGGLIYLLRIIDFKKNDKQVKAIEFVMYSMISIIGFILITSTFTSLNYEAHFTYIDEKGNEAEMVYHLPPLVGPNEGILQSEVAISPMFNVYPNIKSSDLNTVIWSLIAGLFLYYVIRLVTRKKVGELFQPLLHGVSPQAADEISYRAIAIGFPIFTLGGLIFAMIWAQIAWTRFWAWDPKEVWALVTFLFYAAYLHLRLSRGWQGEKSAWLCVIGFAIIMFNLIFVNLVIFGLHSYA